MANICFPVAMPPAATTGMETWFMTSGMRTKLVVSSFPLCPPASNPSAITISTFESSAFWANFGELTTWRTVQFSFFNCFVKSLGFPAEVIKILILFLEQFQFALRLFHTLEECSQQAVL